MTGDPLHPANAGRLCSKGSALGDTLGLDDRLLNPTLEGNPIDWDTALDTIARRFKNCIEEHGPESIGFYVSGQLLTEDYYVVNKFVKGWLGTANIDTNSRLCMASSVAGHKRAFGSDTVPGCYEDLELADLVVLVGSNLAWCHPVLFQRLIAARAARPNLHIVLIDPRRTATAELADTYLSIAPDSDIELFTGLLRAVALRGMVDRSYVDEHVGGLDEALLAASVMSLPEVARATGVATDVLDSFYERFIATKRVVTVFSQGVNQSSCGTDKVNAIINCHLATGRIGRPGMGPFSITGQPNAMGGREVGGLANVLAAHMDLHDAEHRDIVQRFWKSPRIASEVGLKAVDLFDAVGDGRIKTLWIMATNPADSMPDADKVAQAIQDCPFVIVSDVSRRTDTVALADMALPAQAWGEKDGTVTNSERCISRQRRWRSLSGALSQSRPDWWAVAEVARRVTDSSAFDYSGPAAIFREFAALSGTDNQGQRDFDISACAELSDAAYEALAPFQWPWAKGTSIGATRFFGAGGFFTKDSKARMIPIQPRAMVSDSAPGSVTLQRPVKSEHTLGRGRDLMLNTGRVRDHWHTMTRTGNSARLSAHMGEPFAQLHPEDAARHAIADADLVDVESAQGHIRVRALIDTGQQPGSVFVPMHWTDQNSLSARVCSLIDNRVDPHSGQPDLKGERVSIARHDASSYGFSLSTARLDLCNARVLSYWTRASNEPDGERIELASASLDPERLRRWWQVSAVQHHARRPVEILSFDDAHSSNFRSALFEGDRLLACFFASPEPVQVSRTWASELLAHRYADTGSRWQLLAARASADVPDKGAIVCSCYGVGAEQIRCAIVKQGCADLQSLGDCLQAGTNCGSCRSELNRMLRQIGKPTSDEAAGELVLPAEV